MKETVKDRLIVALDVESAHEALTLFDSLRDSVGMFKIGMQLFTAAGPDIVRQIVSRGGRVFLDLKYHDIPNTVAMAAVEATRLGVTLFNIHASGGSEMMKRTADAVAEISTREKLAQPKILGVTVLTSIDQETLRQLGVDEDPAKVVGRLASLAQASGLDGVVASAQEIKIVRESIAQPDFLIVTPGIRGTSGEAHDQRRTMTAAAAIREGADYLVVGRPILEAADPVRAAQDFVDEIDEAVRTTPAQSNFAEQSRSQSVQ
jgi:orotidine-5'-phosphate decarboxylase